MAKSIYARSNAGKSPQRWADGRKLVDEIMPTLPSQSHRVVMWTVWFHSGLTTQGWSVFNLTKKQIGIACGLKERRVASVLSELESAGVIQTTKTGCNQGGRSLGSERRITWQKYEAKPCTSECMVSDD